MKSRIFLLLTLLIIFSDSQVSAQNTTAVPGQDVVLICDVNGTVSDTQWRINGSSSLVSLSGLSNGAVAGHNASGRNIVVEDIMMNDFRNGSQYECVVFSIPITSGTVTILYVAGVPAIVPGVTVDNNTININRNNVTFTLNWGEPFNNLDPIMNYTVSCSGNDTCSPNFTTTDSTTRSYTITNLTPMTNYTFSVVATNSVGSGEAGTINYTTEAIEQVTGVILACEAVGFNNTCSATWNPVKGRNITVYQVCYNGKRMNVTSPNTTLIFPAPPILGDVFMDNVTVTVAAFNRRGIGPSSDPETEQIYGSSVTNVTVTGLFNVSTRLTANDSDTDVYISYIIAVSDIITLNISNMKNVIFRGGNFRSSTSKMLSPGDNFTFFLKSSNRSIQLSVIDTNATNDTSSAITGMVSVTVVDVETEYNISVACNIHSESMADVCMVAAMGTDNSNPIQNISTISNNMANVILTKLNCDEEYTIIAGGILNGNLFGPKSDQGSIYKSLCGPISVLLNRIFSELRRIEFIRAAVLLAIVLSIIASILLTIFVLGCCGAFLKERKTEKTTVILAVIRILFIVSFGLGWLFSIIYRFGCRRKGKTLNDVQPDKVEMQSGDVYASPKKKETDAEATSTDQGLYSYARTGPINVIVPDEKP